MEKSTNVGEITINASIDTENLEVFSAKLKDAANMIDEAINLLSNAEKTEIKAPIHLTQQ